MASNDDHLFNRIVSLVTDFVDGTDAAKPSVPPPIPEDAKRPEPKIHRHADRISSLQQRARLLEEADVEAVAGLLSDLAASMEMKKTLLCFSHDQLFKLDIGYHELMKNAAGHLTAILDAAEDKARGNESPVSTARHDMLLSLLKQATKHVNHMTNELRDIRRAVKAGKKPTFDNFVDALGRALEVVGYDEKLMEVEKKVEPDTIPGDILPKRCRIALTVAESSKAGRGQAISLSMKVK